jgi:preprotein translocase subunit SecD
LRHRFLPVICALLFLGCRDATIRRSSGDPIATLEFRLEADSPATSGAVPFADPTGRPILLRPDIVIRNADIGSVVVEESQGHFSVGLRFIPSAATRLQRETAANVGHRMAVLLDGKVLVAPVIQSAISAEARLDAGFSRYEANRVARSLAPPATP